MKTQKIKNKNFCVFCHKKIKETESSCRVYCGSECRKNHNKDLEDKYLNSLYTQYNKAKKTTTKLVLDDLIQTYKKEKNKREQFLKTCSAEFLLDIVGYECSDIER